MPSELCRYTVALPGPGPMVDRLRSRGVMVEIRPLESWRWWVRTPKQMLKFPLSLPWQMVNLRRWMRFLQRLQPDLVHFNINRLVEPIMAARLLDIPNVMHFRDIPSRINYHFILGLKGFYRLMNLADCWIANSKATANDIRPYAHQPVRTIPNAIDLDCFDQMTLFVAPILPSTRNSSFSVAMIGGLNPWKDQKSFVQLAIDILEMRQDISFYLVGGGQQTPYGLELKRLVRHSGFQDHIHFLGYVDNIPALLTELDVLIHTMPFESFGRVFIEAMAARRPVIAFDSGGASEIVVNGETGVLVSPGDVEAMAEAVDRLLDDPATRRRMGKAGRKRVEEYYTLDRHCRAVADVYDELLAMRN